MCFMLLFLSTLESCWRGLGELFFFFFQAERGIRDLVLARGLGWGDKSKNRTAECEKIYNASRLSACLVERHL